MPIGNAGGIGRPGLVAVPAGLSNRQSDGRLGGMPRSVGGLSGGSPTLQRGLPFRSPSFSAIGTFITGVTKDRSTGTPVAGVTVDLYLTANDQKVDSVVSDGSGNFSFGATAGPYYLVAYKAGSPDVFGTSVNTLSGA